MLKIKQSQVLIAMIDGIGSFALASLIFQATGLYWLGMLAGVTLFAVAAWILIKNQNGHSNFWGYANFWTFVLSLIWIALDIHWLVALALAVIFTWVGMRYYPVNIGPNTKR